MAARGGQRRPRQQRPRVPNPNPGQPVDRAPDEPLVETRIEPAPAPGPASGRIVRYRISALGSDQHRPAIVIRDDAPGFATLYVFTLPGDSIAAGARIAQQRAVNRPHGDGVGEWCDY